MNRARFLHVYCSNCGGEFGPGDAGFSHCSDHAGMVNHDDSEPAPVLTAVQVLKQMEASRVLMGDFNRWPRADDDEPSPYTEEALLEAERIFTDKKFVCSDDRALRDQIAERGAQ